MTDNEFKKIMNGDIKSPYGCECIVCGRKLDRSDHPAAWELLKSPGKTGNFYLYCGCGSKKAGRKQ